MRGIDEARKLYDDYGRDMISSFFPEYEERIAVGLAGHGSQCFGFDDDISRDHDFQPGFCLWLTDVDDIKIGAELQSAYLTIPANSSGGRSLMGDTAVGVRRTGEPEDIANAAAWLAAEESGYVTGQTIGVNGGRVVS